ncbi:hypothetical protein CXG81DRAFT_13210 [Caulochytrium protostelioides]|uniref:Proteasome subunit alpha type n=2 Tax=Caulochytrium protostelioides TaxID=1555241 RepID=A0A4P9X5Q5_9FUNG|nr:hypothetical protein CXG81DRAFT_13210 [Caulochytrium protostelioides]|eukprot:RKP00452.1 hypothetical protein CXG81DRAFT_13210 [Caulochytrium protostelioides]
MSGYDRALTIFSPDGHLFQVEYAAEAVNKGTCVVGIKGASCSVLAVEKRSILKLQSEHGGNTSKIKMLDDHVWLAFAGLNADAGVLVDKARVECQSHRLTIEDPVTVEYIARHIASIQQRYTQSGGVRPFGLSTLIVGVDPHDVTKQPQLYQTDPSGIFTAWKATAIGRSSATVRTFLEKHWTAGLDEDAAVKLAVKGLLEVVQTGAKNLEVAVMGSDAKLRILSTEAVEAVTKRIEDEEAAEQEKKARRKGAAAAQATA